MMNAFNIAMARAAHGLDWSYPCLIWLADYLRDATGTDWAAAWRDRTWSENTARRELARIAIGGSGRTAVECAMDRAARQHGWLEAECPMQGAVMVGVYTDPDGEVGIPAIFDGSRRWMHAGTGAVTITAAPPERMWEVPCAASR